LLEEVKPKSHLPLRSFVLIQKNRSGGPSKNQGSIHFLTPFGIPNWEIKKLAALKQFLFLIQSIIPND
jgi:hypothetical protein